MTEYGVSSTDWDTILKSLFGVTRLVMRYRFKGGNCISKVLSRVFIKDENKFYVSGYLPQ